jgi:hypothetical protein
MRGIALHRWPLTVAMAVSMQLLVAAMGAAAERDHLTGYTITDLNRATPPANPYTMTDQFTGETCTLSRPLYFLEQSAKNDGDDARGGPAGRYVCYKARCPGPRPSDHDFDTQFGDHLIHFRVAKIVCLPADQHICGDLELDPGEACDGAAGACPGSQVCTRLCTCVDPCPSSGGDATACTGVTSSLGCIGCCGTNSACQTACGAAIDQSCTDGTANDQCGAAMNAAGCAQCCQ